MYIPVQVTYDIKIKDGFALKKSWKNQRTKVILWLIYVGPPLQKQHSEKPVQTLESGDLTVILVILPGIDSVTQGSSLLPCLQLSFPICKIKKWNPLGGLWALFIFNFLLFLSIAKRGSNGALTKKRKNPKIQKCCFVRTSQACSQNSRTGALHQKISLWKSAQRPNRKAGSRGKQLFPCFIQEQGDIS